MTDQELQFRFSTALFLSCVCSVILFADTVSAAEGLFPKMPAAPKVYVVDCRRKENSQSSRMTALALEGLINQKSAEVFIMGNPHHLEQLKFSNKPFEMLTLPAGNNPGLRALFQKYQSRVKKMFLYDQKKDWSWFLALMASSQQEGIPVTEVIKDELISEFHWNGEVEDFRSRWPDKMQAYDWALKNLMPNCSRQVVFVPKFEDCAIIDYVVAAKGFAFRLNFQKEQEEIRKIFRANGYGFGTSLMGYAGDEANAVANQYGIGYVVSDFYANGSFWSSFPNKTYTQPPGKAIKAEPGKIYASITWSDGDNIAFDQNPLFEFWRDSDRGKVPVATPLSPTLQELNSPLLDWYYAKMTDKDELMAGPTGVQFIYIRDYKDDLFPAWCRLSRTWCADAGFHAARIWIAPFPSVKYSTYLSTCGLDGLFGEGWRLKTGFPPKIDTFGAWTEDKLYEEFAKIKPDSNAPVFVSFTPIVEGFNKRDGGYSAVKRQVERLQTNYPGLYMFLLPKDQFATINAYYDSANVKQVQARPDKEDGLKAVKSGDGRFTIAERAGALCWIVPKQTPTGSDYFYLDVENEFRPKPGQTLEVQLNYLDVGTGEVTFEYDSTDIRPALGGAYKGYPYRLRRMNTGKWQTARFFIKDAGFGGSENDGADFRFHNEGDELSVSTVQVRRMAN